MRLLHHRSAGVTMRRPRWVALGAMIAVTLGAGGVITSAASETSVAASFVAITPCRLLDTRPAPDNVGTRSTPVGAGDTFTTTVSGTNGQCSIPASAIAASFNVTAIAPTAASFLTVFPADRPRPVAASLNWIAGQAPTPNAVTTRLSADGSVSFYNLAGTVQLTVDVVGYYAPAGVGDVGPAGPKGDPGDAAPRPLHILWVAKSGGDFTTVSAALASIHDNDGLHPYLIRVAPGTYAESTGIDLLDYVDIEGSGENVTTLICGCSSEGVPLVDGSSALVRASGTNLHSEVRRITISNAGGPGTYATAVWIGNVSGGRVSLDHVTANVLAASGHFAYGVGVVSAEATAESLTVEASGAGVSTGVFVIGATSNVVVRDAHLRGSVSMLLFVSAHAVAYDSVFNGNTSGMSGRCVGAMDTSLSPYSCL